MSDAPQTNNGFFINQGTLNGHFTTPEGDEYNIRRLEPREVTDPRDGRVSTIWGGYAAAKSAALEASDAKLQVEFKASGKRPAEFFPPEAKDIPLWITLREAKEPKHFSHIGSVWTSKGRYTILARDREGKSGLRFGGNVLPYKSPEALAAERQAKLDVHKPDAAERQEKLHEHKPDGDAAHSRAKARVKGEPKDKPEVK
jgi:hypothetical protein